MRISKHIPELLVLVLGAVAMGAVVLSRIKGEKVNEIDAGAIVELENVATAFMEVNRTRIETDKGIFYVPGVIEVDEGSDCQSGEIHIRPALSLYVRSRKLFDDNW